MDRIINTLGGILCLILLCVFLCIFFMIIKAVLDDLFGSNFLIKIAFILLGIFLIFFLGNESYNLNKYGLNYKEINYIKKNLSEEEKLKYEYCINNLSTFEEKEKFSTDMYLKLKEKEDRKIENMVNSF